MRTRAKVDAGRARRRNRLGLGLAALLAMTCLTRGAEARISMRPDAPFDAFYFHAQYFGTPFDPAQSLGVQVWNCASGVMPVYIADRVPLVVCDWDAATGYVLADLAYEVALPAGDCDDRGRSCSYRDRSAASDGGVRSLRVDYARRNRTKIWLESFGDLSAVQQANMLLLITIDGTPRAALSDTFRPLPNGGWYSPY